MKIPDLEDFLVISIGLILVGSIVGTLVSGRGFFREGV